MSNTETTGLIPHDEATKDSSRNISTLMTETITLLQVSTQTIRIKPGAQNDQKIPDWSEYRKIPSDASNPQFQSQNTAAFPFSQFKNFWRRKIFYIALIEKLNQLQSNPNKKINQKDSLIIPLCWIQSLPPFLPYHGLRWFLILLVFLPFE